LIQVAVKRFINNSYPAIAKTLATWEGGIDDSATATPNTDIAITVATTIQAATAANAYQFPKGAK
jgi:hypothetical protein